MHSKDVFYDKINIEIDQKDILISHLREENIQLRYRQPDLESLVSNIEAIKNEISQKEYQNLNVEKSIQEKQEIVDRSIKSLTEEYSKLKDNIQATDLLNATLEKEILEIKAQILLKKDELNSANIKGIELKELKQKQENDLKILKELQQKIEGDLIIANKELSTEKIHLLEKEDTLKLQQSQIEMIETKNWESAKKNEELKKEKEYQICENQLLDNDLKHQIFENEEIKKKAQSSKELYHKLQSEKDQLERNVENLEKGMKNLEIQIIEKNNLINFKEKTLVDAKTNLSLSEEKALNFGASISQLRREKADLELMMEKYKNDSLLNKQMFESNSVKLKECEEEKQKLEMESAVAEAEAKKTLRELDNIKNIESNLLREKMQKEKEIEAFHSHSLILENQNQNLYKEIDNILQVDEIARDRLDRKERIERIKLLQEKEKNESLTKVIFSKSPKKI